MQPGDTLGRYLIEAQLARGGMAEVWLAVSKGVGGFQKRVVLKTILPDLAENPDFVRMFINEALLAARLNHPHIVQIFDLGNIGGCYFIAMEYVPGRSLRQVSRACRQRGALIPQWFVLRVLSIVCEALQYAHDHCDDQGRPLELVHRDVTPENIMISFTGAVKVLDFGVAKASAAASLTRAGTLKGKYAYISPEQVCGASADRRSDIYSCGVILYELLAGMRPFRGENDLDLLRKVAQGNPTPPRKIAPWISEGLERIILKALAKDPNQRFAEAGQAAEEILAYLSTIKDRHSQRELSLFVSALFPDEPAIPSDVLRKLSSGQSFSIESALAAGADFTLSPAPAEAVQLEYDDIEIVKETGEVHTATSMELPESTDATATPARQVYVRPDSTTFEITGLEPWLSEPASEEEIGHSGTPAAPAPAPAPAADESQRPTREHPAVAQPDQGSAEPAGEQPGEGRKSARWGWLKKLTAPDKRSAELASSAETRADAAAVAAAAATAAATATEPTRAETAVVEATRTEPTKAEPSRPKTGETAAPEASVERSTKAEAAPAPQPAPQVEPTAQVPAKPAVPGKKAPAAKVPGPTAARKGAAAKQAAQPTAQRQEGQPSEAAAAAASAAEPVPAASTAKGPGAEASPPASAEEAPSTALQPPAAELQPPISPTKTPAAELPRPSSTAKTPAAELPRPSTPLKTPTVELPRPSSTAKTPTAELPRPSSTAKTPAAELPRPSTPLKTPTMELPRPSSMARTPAAEELKTPAAELPRPSSTVKMPAVELPRPSSTAKTPAAELPRPSSTVKMPAVELPRPSTPLKTPTVELPRPSSTAKTPAAELPRPSTPLKTPTVELPRPSSTAKTPAAELPRPSSTVKMPAVELPRPSSTAKTPAAELPRPSTPLKTPTVELPRPSSTGRGASVPDRLAARSTAEAGLDVSADVGGAAGSQAEGVPPGAGGTKDAEQSSFASDRVAAVWETATRHWFAERDGANAEAEDPIAALWAEASRRQGTGEASPSPESDAADTTDPIAALWAEVTRRQGAEERSAGAEDDRQSDRSKAEPDLPSPYGIPTHAVPTGGDVADVFGGFVRRRSSGSSEGGEDDIFTSYRGSAAQQQAAAQESKADPFSRPQTIARDTEPEPARARDEGISARRKDPWSRSEQKPMPRSAAGCFDRGLEAMRKGAYAEALEYWQTAVSLEPENRVYQSNLRLLTRLLEIADASGRTDKGPR